jgi:Mrp family chromosome partitioning ATPase
LKQLKQRYDYIIIDSPPYDVVTDAFLLMKYADIKLFVTRIGTITRKALRNCLNDFQVKEIDKVYMLLNGIKNMNSSKYSYYYHKTKTKRNRFKRVFRKKVTLTYCSFTHLTDTPTYPDMPLRIKALLVADLTVRDELSGVVP